MKNQRSKTGIVIIAVIISIVLYVAGVLSGLYANKIVEQRTERSLEQLKAYVDVLDANVRNVQLEQVFVETLNHDDFCKFSAISMNNLVDQLRAYWQQLPFRIEEYEQNTPLSEEYLLLKKQYTQVSLRSWVVAKSTYEQCDTDLVPILYFYSQNCTNCIEQGKELDRLQQLITAQGKDVLIFTVDMDADEPVIKTIATYYAIDQAPALIINNQVFQGSMFTAGQLQGYI